MYTASITSDDGHGKMWHVAAFSCVCSTDSNWQLVRNNVVRLM